jgi:hypothetical protein
VASNNSANQQFAYATTTRWVNVLRIEAALREDVLAELKRLEGNLVAEVAQLPETPVTKRSRISRRRCGKYLPMAWRILGE